MGYEVISPTWPAQNENHGERALHDALRRQSADIFGPPTLRRSRRMTLNPVVLWSLEDWADSVMRLPVTGPLPQRTVLVPNERVAHALRCTLTERNQQVALVGTRFLPLLELAREVVADAGESAVVNDADLTHALVREAFAQITFERFASAELLGLPGWDHAFAAAIRELEAAEVEPSALLSSDDSHVRDVGRVFAALGARTERRSASTVLRRAAELIAADPSRAHEGATLAVVSGFESQAEVRLLCTLPAVTWAAWAVRPAREEHLARLRSVHGESFAHALREATAPLLGDSGLSTLKARLFSAATTTPAAPEDKTVEVVTYAGVHEEVDAAVGWVVEQILERGVPAQQIALISPVPDAYASLLAARLGALPWPEGVVTSFVERGVPLIERADGARLLALLRALREGLPRAHVATLLPWLRPTGEERKVRGPSHAWRLVNAVGWVGGERSHLEGGLGWDQAWKRAVLRLDTRTKASEGRNETQDKSRTKQQLDLAVLGAAIEGLTAILQGVVDDQPLGEIWTQLRAYLTASLRLPPSSPPVWSLVDEAVAVHESERQHTLTGVKALEWLEDVVLGRLVRSGRFGMPAVYIGSLAGVRGLSFRAVRVLGMVEGALPSAVREDPVLPDAARRALSPHLPTSRSRSHRQLASFDDALRATASELVLSAPRVSIDGSARQPAAVLLDVMRALGGAADQLEESLESQAASMRKRERRQREVLAISESARLGRVAAGERARAQGPDVISLEAMRKIARRPAPGAQDGLLAGLIPHVKLPGLTPENPISATRLATLLSCPHRYLLERVLHWQAPDGPLPSHTLDSLSFGSLLHEVAEAFWLEHGESFGARNGDLPSHQQAMMKMAAERFAVFRASYPFVSESVAQAQEQAFCAQLTKLLDYDWDGGTPRTFVAVEREFGYDHPCTLNTAAGPLHVRGSIDRLDGEADSLLIRDLKSGRSKPRKVNEPPDLSIDLQLGLYARVAKQLATTWSTPTKVGVAYVYLRSGEPERRWTGQDYDALHATTENWLATAVDTLGQGAFVRSPDREDCTFCAHKAVCEPEHERTARTLQDAAVPRRLVQLKGGETP